MLAFDIELALRNLPLYFCALSLVLRRGRDVRLRRDISRRRHLVRVVVVQASVHPLFFGEPGKLVVIEPFWHPAMLAGVFAEARRLVGRLEIWLILGLL